jgi:AraC-like DNA-binding protein
MDMRLDGDARALRGERQGKLPVLVVVLESSLAHLRVGGTLQRLDRANLALVPSGEPYKLLSDSPAARVLTLTLPPALLQGVAKEYAPHVDVALFARVLGAPRVLPRTRWLDELIHRYVFERDECEKHDSAAARFLETEIGKELYFVGKETLSPAKPRASVVHEEDVLARRAREHIEDHLFEALRVADLARACHASESTLLRAFRKELGVAPIAYIRTRRLDEARLLLRAGRYSVGEVAERVGYANVAAFTAAFRRRFKELPSRVTAAR